MAKRPTLTDVTSLTNSSAINTLSQNWDAIEEAFDNTLSLDGGTPNAMRADLDLNGNALLNVGVIDVDELTLNGQQVTDLATVPEWKGPWVTATNYFKNDLVRSSGSSYICLVDHTSGTFSTDLTSLKWQLFAQQGAAGAGTGDMVGANNLSDVADVAAARSNLGLGTVATEITVPISKGGTGATDAASAIIALGAQPLGSTLTSLESLSLAAGDVLYATAADTLTRLPKGTAGQVLKMNSGATAPEWVDAVDTVAWALVASGALSGATIDITSGLDGANEVMVVLVAAIVSGSNVHQLRVGNSGGFLTGSIYREYSGSGTFARMSDGAAGGRSSCLIISRWSETTGVKPCSGQLYASSSPTVAIATATALDRIRLFCGSSGTYTAGTYEIYRR